MQQPRKKPKISRIRIERPQNIDLHAGEEASWAVSYSDLLMVMMSFFVIFSSFESKKRQSVLEQIAISMNAKDTKQSSSAHVSGQGGSSGFRKVPVMKGNKISEAGLAQELTQKLAMDHFKVFEQPKTHGLVIWLPDNLYKKREFEVSRNVKRHLDYLLKSLYPYRDKITILFIGHTDSLPIKNRTKLLTSNFSLSSLRATRALEYAIRKGFPAHHLFSKGASQNERNSRTLSVKVYVFKQYRASH